MSKRAVVNPSLQMRLLSMLASLIFSVPTAALIWLGLNKELAFWGGFLDSRYLVVTVVAFALAALLFPLLFPSLLGAVWRYVLKVQHWWGW
jgi:hypothetical protein